MEKETWQKLKAIVDFALRNKHSAFYKHKYSSCGVHSSELLGVPEDFSVIPYLTKDELIRTDPFDRLFIPVDDVDYVATTSGTTADRPLIMFRRKRSRPSTPIRHLHSSVAKRTLIFTRLPGALQAYNTLRQKNILVLFGEVTKLPETAYIAAALSIDSIMGPPTIITAFASYLTQRYELSRIRALTFVAEPLTQVQREFFRRKFPNAVVSQLYGLAETSSVGWQCDLLIEQQNNWYHAHEDRFFYELVHSANATVNTGELVVTHLTEEPSLLIRYRTGDLIEFIVTKCLCGSPHKLFRVIGRITNDKVKINGVEFSTHSFDEAMKCQLDRIEDRFTANFYHRMVGDKIVGEVIVDIVVRQNIGVTPELKEALSSNFNKHTKVSNRFSFTDFVERGLFLPIKVNFVERRSLYKAVSKKRLIPHF